MGDVDDLSPLDPPEVLGQLRLQLPHADLHVVTIPMLRDHIYLSVG